MKRFTEEMDDLVDSMVKMAKLATEMSNKSISSFCKRDVGVADDVINSFSVIRNYDTDIEKKAIRILTLYQPAACDMRTIATVQKCITYLERIGKYSKNIADATHYLKDKLTPYGFVKFRSCLKCYFNRPLKRRLSNGNYL